MQKLHLVGFTTDHGGLILSARRNARSGGFQLELDDELIEMVAELQALRGDVVVEGPAPADPQRPRVESTLPVREIQARLRQGRTVQDVAKAAGVDTAWVERFATPVFAEQAQVIRRTRSLALHRARLGPSALPIGDAVRRNLAARGVALSPDEFASAWTARQLTDGHWAIRFSYRHRKADHVLRFDLDEASGEVIAADRASGQLGYVAPTRPASATVPEARAAAPGPSERPVAKRPTVTTGFRRDSDAGRATSRPAKERARASAAMRKAATKRAAAGERAAARRTKEKQLEAVRRERAARVEEAQRARQKVVADKRKAAVAAKKAAVAKKAAAERARKQAERLGAAQARRAEATLAAAERSKAAERAAKVRAAKQATTAAAKATAAKKSAAKKTAAKRAATGSTTTAAASKASAKRPAAEKASAKGPATKRAVTRAAARVPATPPVLRTSAAKATSAGSAPAPKVAAAPPSVASTRTTVTPATAPASRTPASAPIAPAAVRPTVGAPAPVLPAHSTDGIWPAEATPAVVPSGFVTVSPPDPHASPVRTTTAPATRTTGDVAPAVFDIEAMPGDAGETLEESPFEDWYADWLRRQPSPATEASPRRTRPLRAT